MLAPGCTPPQTSTPALGGSNHCNAVCHIIENFPQGWEAVLLYTMYVQHPPYLRSGRWPTPGGSRESELGWRGPRSIDHIPSRLMDIHALFSCIYVVHAPLSCGSKTFKLTIAQSQWHKMEYLRDFFAWRDFPCNGILESFEPVLASFKTCLSGATKGAQ